MAVKPALPCRAHGRPESPRSKVWRSAPGLHASEPTVPLIAKAHRRLALSLFPTHQALLGDTAERDGRCGLQVYFNSSLTYGLMKLFRVPYAVAAPGALIGASNFFELAVATAIALYGPASGAALATVVGVLVEVPVMLSVCRMCIATRHWFEPARSPSA